MKEEESVASSIFEIHDSSINVKELMEEIEKNLKLRNVSEDEILRISSAKFSPESPAGFRQFDPSFTVNLFEKGISPPKFTNPSLWFIKGPLKWLLIKFVDLYSVIDKKLSEKRIKAFYNVVHELIVLKSRQETLLNRFEGFYKDYIDLKVKIGEQVNPDFAFSVTGHLPEKYSDKSDTRILDLLNSNSKTLVLFPEWGEFLNKLKIREIKFNSIAFNPMEFRYIKKNVTDEIRLIEFPDFEPDISFSGISDIILQCNACILPDWVLEKILKTISEFSKSETKIYFRYSNSEISFLKPFRKNYLTTIDPDSLKIYLKSIGFKNIVKHETSKDEFSLITFAIP
ncbi:MAG: hypothetical protein K8R21_11840 [Leptospira sp.]|nr:hypothetical protein [Leptospira sp.]